MAFDFGYLIALGLVLYIVAVSYKKKTGNNISELWKGWKSDAGNLAKEEYRKVYITKGIKQ